MTREDIEGFQERCAANGPAELVFLAQMALEGDDAAWRAVEVIAEETL